MEAGEIDKLVKRLSDEAAFYNWNKKITEALNTDMCLSLIHISEPTRPY